MLARLLWCLRAVRRVVHAAISAEASTLAMLEHRLRTQDNRATAWPLYLVQDEERIYGMDGQWAQEGTGYIWQDYDEPECTYDSDEELLAHHRDEDECFDHDDGDPFSLEDGIDPNSDRITIGSREYERIYYEKRWKFVSAHLTEAAAEAYIEQNRHNLKHPRVYVESQHRCWEWQHAVRFLGWSRGG